MVVVVEFENVYDDIHSDEVAKVSVRMVDIERSRVSR